MKALKPIELSHKIVKTIICMVHPPEHNLIKRKCKTSIVISIFTTPFTYQLLFPSCPSSLCSSATFLEGWVHSDHLFKSTSTPTPRPLIQLSFLPGPHRCLFIISLTASPLVRTKKKVRRRKEQMKVRVKINEK